LERKLRNRPVWARGSVKMKLIRDKIPEIAKAKGEVMKVHLASDEEFARLLIAKLVEEAAEFRLKPSVEELADVLEVVRALSLQFGGMSEVEKAREKKADERGVFSKKIILE